MSAIVPRVPIHPVFVFPFSFLFVFCTVAAFSSYLVTEYKVPIHVVISSSPTLTSIQVHMVLKVQILFFYICSGILVEVIINLLHLSL